MIVACLLNSSIEETLDVIDSAVPECRFENTRQSFPRAFTEHVPKFDSFSLAFFAMFETA